jgi:DNA-binding SARP family transcriptional activator
MIAIGHEEFTNNKTVSIEAYSQAIKLYNGPYLPDRMYEDWCSEERERLNVLILGALINLAQLLLENNSMESIRLCQKALQMDKTWEDAYRVQMEAYIKNGNRPMALRTYTECENVLDEEFGISPLPITKSLLKRIEALGS